MSGNPFKKAKKSVKKAFKSVGKEIGRATKKMESGFEKIGNEVGRPFERMGKQFDRWGNQLEAFPGKVENAFNFGIDMPEMPAPPSAVTDLSADEARRRETNRRGRASTILTGSSDGELGSANIGSRTLGGR